MREIAGEAVAAEIGRIPAQGRDGVTQCRGVSRRPGRSVGGDPGPDARGRGRPSPSLPAEHHLLVCEALLRADPGVGEKGGLELGHGYPVGVFRRIEDHRTRRIDALMILRNGAGKADVAFRDAVWACAG
jgi:hypothetical protein